MSSIYRVWKCRNFKYQLKVEGWITKILLHRRVKLSYFTLIIIFTSQKEGNLNKKYKKKKIICNVPKYI